MNMPSHYALRAVLVVAGLAIVFLGLNVALGGILTMGWQGGSTPFLTVTDPALFAVRDNHIRFIGGVWLGVGVIFLVAAFLFSQLRITLLVLIGMIFLGGLARFSVGDPAVFLDPAISPSLLLELIGFPLLGWWIARAA